MITVGAAMPSEPNQITAEPGSGRLRLGMLAPISWRVPPRHYGPWEQFVSLLTEGLVKRGVDVTLFATADSITGARLVGTAPTGYSEDAGLDAKVWECLHVSELFERAGEFDLIHNSYDFLPLTYSALVATPVVTTIHGFSSELILPVFQKYNATGHYVSISDADRHESLDYIATIHHGIELGSFRLGTGRAATCFSSGGSTPTREPPRRSRWPRGAACRSSSPGSSRTRTTSTVSWRLGSTGT